MNLKDLQSLIAANTTSPEAAKSIERAIEAYALTRMQQRAVAIGARRLRPLGDQFVSTNMTESEAEEYHHRHKDLVYHMHYADDLRDVAAVVHWLEERGFDLSPRVPAEALPG